MGERIAKARSGKAPTSPSPPDPRPVSSPIRWRAGPTVVSAGLRQEAMSRTTMHHAAVTWRAPEVVPGPSEVGRSGFRGRSDGEFSGVSVTWLCSND